MTTTISDPEATPATRAPQQQVDIADLVGVTPELRALLTGYSDALDSVTNGFLGKARKAMAATLVGFSSPALLCVCFVRTLSVPVRWCP